MKEIKVKSIAEEVTVNSIEEISMLLNIAEKHVLDYVPWSTYPDKPNVSFSIAYDAANIYLKYFVTEKFIRSETLLTNGPVHEDSCVEFFISFDADANYYNIEFNCIGTGHIGYGICKENRHTVDSSVIKKIQKISNIIAKNDKSAQWELTLGIPLSTFIYSPPINLKNIKCQANFYKCGDLLPEPHYISWSNINAAEPNFHLPEFFGNLIFV